MAPPMEDEEPVRTDIKSELNRMLDDLGDFDTNDDSVLRLCDRIRIPLSRNLQNFQQRQSNLITNAERSIRQLEDDIPDVNRVLAAQKIELKELRDANAQAHRTIQQITGRNAATQPERVSIVSAHQQPTPQASRRIRPPQDQYEAAPQPLRRPQPPQDQHGQPTSQISRRRRHSPDQYEEGTPQVSSEPRPPPDQHERRVKIFTISADGSQLERRCPESLAVMIREELEEAKLKWGTAWTKYLTDSYRCAGMTRRGGQCYWTIASPKILACKTCTNQQRPCFYLDADGDAIIRMVVHKLRPQENDMDEDDDAEGSRNHYNAGFFLNKTGKNTNSMKAVWATQRAMAET